MREITISSQQIISAVANVTVISVMLWLAGCFFWATSMDDNFYGRNIWYRISAVVGGILVIVSSITIIAYAFRFVKEVWDNDREFTFGTPKTIPKAKVNKL